jgi:ketosteroid isomerase-like protein
MIKCPNCGREVGEEYNFCKYCGAKLSDAEIGGKVELSPEAEIENILTKRFDGLKNRDKAAIKSVIDEHYNKFDDWEPLKRQEAEKALKNEFGAFKVLSNYVYELTDPKMNIFGDFAVVTFYIHYQGEIRNRHFEISSRVSSVLRKQNTGWKIIHEHFSRFPEETRHRFWQ